VQATAYTYDPETRTGSVLLDDGTPVPFDAAAFDAGGLRLLRPGQRVRIEVTKTAESTTATAASTATETGKATRATRTSEAAPQAAPQAAEPGAPATPAPAGAPDPGLRITLITLQTL
jgi:hypothetical protein